MLAFSKSKPVLVNPSGVLSSPAAVQARAVSALRQLWKAEGAGLSWRLDPKNESRVICFPTEAGACQSLPGALAQMSSALPWARTLPSFIR